jgi:thiamine pyridinylase
VPEKADLFAHIKDSFEAAYPEVALTIVDLSDNYYDESKPHAVTNTDADVYEVDSVFLEDLVASGRLQPLPTSLLRTGGTFLPVADAAVRLSDATYGVPHWVCTNFLFLRSGDKLESATTLIDLRNGITISHKAGKGLLIDMKGKSTLGELYLDALLDRDRTFEKASTHISPDTFDPDIGDVLKDVRQLCDANLCRDSGYHEADGFYARLFAHGRGRALVGYSERLYYIGEENINGCVRGECTPLSEITIRALPLSDTGSQPFAWVDSLAIAASCKYQCAADAEAFIRHTSSIDEVRTTLLPAYNRAPRYLLPALAGLYIDKELTEAAPLYGPLLEGVKSAIPVRGRMLNTNLREIGRRLDNDVLPK